MDLSLTEHEKRFAEEVDSFLSENLTPALQRAQFLTASVFPEPEISIAWQEILHARGWGAPSWPKQYGGTGWTLQERYIFESRCAAAGTPIQHPLGLRMVGPVIMKFGSAEQKDFFLPRILSGADYWCQGYSEPSAGSDLASLRTRATREGEHYVVSGSKIWTTHAHRANRMFALVRTGTGQAKQEGISFLLIDMDLPGISVRPIMTIGGDHEVNEVFLDDVTVPAGNLVGEEGKGWSYGKYLLEFERGGSITSPRLQADLEWLRKLAFSCANDGAGESLDSHTERELACLSIEIDALEMTELRVMSSLESGTNPGPVASSLLKLRASQLRQRISELAIRMIGQELLLWQNSRPLYTVATDRPRAESALVAAPRYLDDRSQTIFGGTSEIQREILSRQLFNI